MQHTRRMSLSKYESTRGTTHLARIARAILGPCIDVLREVLAKEISPPDLERKVKTYIHQNKKPSISKQQKRLVYGKNYSVFDVTLLYFLLRNMSSIPQHKNNWGKDPELTDKSVSANIERVRILRNEWYGHATDFSLSDSDFEQRWNHISQIVKELEGYLGTETKYQDTFIFDIIDYEDAKRHTIQTGDRVLATWEPEGERFCPGVVIEGQEKRQVDGKQLYVGPCSLNILLILLVSLSLRGPLYLCHSL